jgi:hypothetical protein
MFLKRLTQNYPLIIIKSRIEILISLCVSLILILLKPFSIDNLRSGVLFLAISYGLLTFIGLYIFNNILKKVIYQHTNKWTVFREIIFITSLLFFITTLNYIFTSWYNQQPWKFNNYFIWIQITFSVGFFPTILSVLYILYQSKMSQINSQKEPSVLTDSQDVISVTDSLGNNTLTMHVKDFLYAEIRSYTLYINCLHNGVLKQYQMRATISNIEKAICSEDIVRCHRSFIVNTRYIDTIEGNSNGYKLYLKNCNDVIPVSRRYTLLMKEILDKNFITA